MSLGGMRGVHIYDEGEDSKNERESKGFYS